MDCRMLLWKAAKEDDRLTFDDKSQKASNNFLLIKYLEIDVITWIRTAF